MWRTRLPCAGTAWGCAANALANKVRNSRRFSRSNRIRFLDSQIGQQDIELPIGRLHSSASRPLTSIPALHSSFRAGGKRALPAAGASHTDPRQALARVLWPVWLQASLYVAMPPNRRPAFES